MRIAVQSRSPAVTRTLEAMLTLAGHETSAVERAELRLADRLHPALEMATDVPAIAIGGTDGVACPLRLAGLLQAIERGRTVATRFAHGWELDRTGRCLTRAGQPAVPLTEKECSLLQALAGAAAPLPRETLLAEVWGLAEDVETHTLETHIYRLRAKLAGLSPPAGDLETVGGAYRLSLG